MKSKTETRMEKNIFLLLDAVKSDNERAGEILRIVQQLDEEHSQIRAAITHLVSQPRHTHQDHVKFYQAAIPAIDRLLAIQLEKQRIIHHKHLYNQP